MDVNNPYLHKGKDLNKRNYESADSLRQISPNIRLNDIKADRRSMDRDRLILENRVM
jgi:hypothetical protein